MITLTPKQRRELRAQAHSLHPVVSVGQQGLTPQVMHEIDIALRAHALVKVRVFSDDRAERESMLAQIAGELDAAPVQHIGKLLIVWRPKEEAAAEKPRRPTAKAGRRSARHANDAPPRGTNAPGERVGRRERNAPTSARRTEAKREAREGTPENLRRRRRAVTGAAAPRSASATMRRADESTREDARKPRGKSAPNPRRRRRTT